MTVYPSVRAHFVRPSFTHLENDRGRRRPERKRTRPRLEGLEDRCLLSMSFFPIPTPASPPWSISSGPDGNLWFTESWGNKVGVINPTSHAITEFALPTANASPVGIAAGPDGNLWFTENLAGKIGMINPTTYAISEFAIPST